MIDFTGRPGHGDKICRSIVAPCGQCVKQSPSDGNFLWNMECRHPFSPDFVHRLSVWQCGRLTPECGHWLLVVVLSVAAAITFVCKQSGLNDPVSIKWSLGTIPNFYASTIIRIRLDILHHTPHQPPAWHRRDTRYHDGQMRLQMISAAPTQLGIHVELFPLAHAFLPCPDWLLLKNTLCKN